MEVRVLGCLALVDGGETDWKLIVVDANDSETARFGRTISLTPLPPRPTPPCHLLTVVLSSYNDIEDVPVERVSEAREWFRMYKTAEGKGENKFGLDEKAMPKAYARKVADETFGEWMALAHKQVQLFPAQKSPRLDDVECRSSATSMVLIAGWRALLMVMSSKT